MHGFDGMLRVYSEAVVTPFCNDERRQSDDGTVRTIGEGKVRSNQTQADLKCKKTI